MLELTTYRKKGINAYLAPAVNGKPDTAKALYGKPKPGDEDKAHKGKCHTIQIELSAVPDGVYIWKEAGGADNNKAKYGWIQIVGGEIIEQGEGEPK